MAQHRRTWRVDGISILQMVVGARGVRHLQHIPAQITGLLACSDHLPSPLIAKGRAWLVLGNQVILPHDVIEMGPERSCLGTSFALFCFILQEQGKRSWEESSKNSFYVI